MEPLLNTRNYDFHDLKMDRITFCSMTASFLLNSEYLTVFDFRGNRKNGLPGKLELAALL